jgi:hypothetical protein
MMVMIPVALGVALVAGYMTMSVPQKEAAAVSVKADVAAANFLSYRTSVQAYYRANPTASGTITDASLAAYWPTGYVRNTTAWPWSNIITGGQTYIHSTNSTCALASCAALVDALYQKQGRPATLGTSVDVSGVLRLRNPGIGLSAIVLPAAIAVDRVVAVGN